MSGLRRHAGDARVGFITPAIAHKTKMVFSRLMPEKPLTVAAMLTAVALTAVWQFDVAVPMPEIGIDQGAALVVGVVIVYAMAKWNIGRVGASIANRAGRSRIVYVLLVVGVVIFLLNYISVELSSIGMMEGGAIALGIIGVIAILTGNSSRLRNVKGADGARILAEAAIIAALAFTVTALAVGGSL